MAREVIWTRRKYELLCSEGMLSDDYCSILEEHIKGHSNLHIAMNHNCDVSVINEAISRLKLVYDELQKEYPDILEPRNPDIFRKKKRKN